MSRKLVPYLIPFLYSFFFTAAVTAAVWLAATYATMNFLTVAICACAAFYGILAVAAAINVCKKNNFLSGSSVDVFSANTQKFIRNCGIALAIPGLAFCAAFAFTAITYNGDWPSSERLIKFSNFEMSVFGKSAIYEYAHFGKMLESPVPIPIPMVGKIAPTEIEPSPAAAEADVDFGPYMADLQRRIKRSWFPPRNNSSVSSKVVFKIASDGTMSDLRMTESTGSELGDKAAMNAVRNASPFRVLPTGAPSSVDVQFTFDYNVFTSHGKPTSDSDAFISGGDHVGSSSGDSFYSVPVEPTAVEPISGDAFATSAQSSEPITF